LKTTIYKYKEFIYFESILLTLYLCNFLRQYFWHFEGVFVWLLSYLISVFILVKLKIEIHVWENKTNFSWAWFTFYCMVPLCFFYCIRFAFPDNSWDVINYHFINGERAVRGFPFINGDFFYLSYSNPVSDMLMTVFRHTLGHRLGTIINLLVLVWSALILRKILIKYIKKEYLLCLIIITLISFEGIIYEISNYWVDLLAIPLMLEVLYFLIFVENKKKSHYFYVTLLMGMAVGFKLTNLYLVLPASILLIYQFIKANNYRKLQTFGYLFSFIIIFLFPLIPFHGYIFLETGNPIYPHFNSIFKSSYASLKGAFDETLGPSGKLETILWPIYMLFKSDRLSPTPMFPFFTTIGYLCELMLI